MGWIAKLFGAASKDELEGLTLDHSCSNWMIGETKDLPKVLNALHYIVGENAAIFIEGCNAKGDLKQFIDDIAIPEKEHIARGTVWPKQHVVHLPATKQNIERLSEFSKDVSPLQIATHFHVYEDSNVIIEWYDAFTTNIFISKSIPEENVRNFAEALGVKYEDEGER